MELDQMTRPELHALIRRYASELTVAHTTAQEQADLAVRQVAIIYGLEQKMATMQHKPQPTPGVGPCAGLNCGATDGVSHSVECAAEHAAVIAGGRFVPKGAPAVTVDTPAFWHVAAAWKWHGGDIGSLERNALVAYIDAHTQAAVKAEAARCNAIMVEKLRHGPAEVAAKQVEIDRLRFELHEATESLVARMAAPQQHAQALQQEGSRPAAYSEMSLGELLERYWNIAFSEGQDGVSRGIEAQEVLSALMAFGKDAQAALSDEQLADPEFVRGYIESQNHSFELTMAELVKARAILAARQPAPDVMRKCSRFGHTCNCTTDCPSTGAVGQSDIAPVAAAAQGEAVRQSAYIQVGRPRLQNWVDVIHDNERSMGDRLQCLSTTFGGLLRGEAVDKYPLRVIREQTDDSYQQGRASGIEEAAKVCESGLIDNATVFENGAMRKCASAIRALNK